MTKERICQITMNIKHISSFNMDFIFLYTVDRKKLKVLYLKLFWRLLKPYCLLQHFFLLRIHGQTMGRENDKWARAQSFAGMILNYKQSCHSESIVLPESLQTIAHCVKYILPFSLPLFFPSHFCGNTSRRSILSPL